MDDNSPLRLLRKKWTDPNDLAQELYAMFRAATAPTARPVPPPTPSVSPPQARPVRPVELPSSFSYSNASNVNKIRSSTSPSYTTPLEATTIEGPTRSIPSSTYEPVGSASFEPYEPVPNRAGPAAGSPASGSVAFEAYEALPDRSSVVPPLVDGGSSFAAEATSMRQPPPPLPGFADPSPLEFDYDPYQWVTPPFTAIPLDFSLSKFDLPDSPTSGTTVFLGQVVSGTGDTYTVNLFGSGSTQPSTAQVTVTIPNIASTETIPANTWINPIFQFSDSSGNVTYECQVPVWLDSASGGA